MQGGLNLYLKEHFYAPLVSQCDYLFEKCLQQLQVKLENILKGSLDSIQKFVDITQQCFALLPVTSIKSSWTTSSSSNVSGFSVKLHQCF